MDDKRTAAGVAADGDSVAGFVMFAESSPAMTIHTRTIVKAVFRCPEANYYGAMVLILPDGMDSASLCQIIGNTNLYGALAPDKPWRELSKNIMDYRYQAKSLSHNAMVAVERTLLRAEDADELQRSASQGPEALRQFLRPLLVNVLSDRTCELNVAIEQADPAEISGLPAGESRPAVSMLRIRFLIDPLNGIPAHRLVPGNKVAVNLQCNEGADRALVDQYQMQDGHGKPLPLIVTVTKVTDREDDAMEIVVAVDDKVQGGAVISKALRLRHIEEPAFPLPAASQAESTPARRPAPAPWLTHELLQAIIGGLAALFLFFLVSRML